MCQAPTPYAASRVWRLNDIQYMNAIKALIPGATVPKVETPGRLANEFINWDTQYPVQEAFASQLSDAAFNVAAQVSKNPSMVVSCATGQADAACAAAFIDKFVSRAFRRPLEDDERKELVNLYNSGVSSGSGFASGIELVVAATLGSPSFIYRTEFGKGGTPGQAVALTSFELASSLGFTLLNSLPDDELWQKALDGSLSDRAVLEKQVDRLLALPAVKDNLTTVSLEWLNVPNVLTLEKTTEDLAGKAFDASVRQSLFDETQHFVSDVLWNGGKVADLFQSRKATLDQRSAAMYGVSAPSGGGTVDLPANRSGILTRAGLIAGIRYGQNPEVFRGKLVRVQLLCGKLSDPPPGVNTDAFNAQYAGLSTAQRIQIRASQSSCGACHSFMDKLGIAFDSFGALGQVVTKVNGVDPAPAGELTGTDVDGPFPDLVGLSQKLAQSKTASQCVVEQMMTYAFGHELEKVDCVRDQIAAQMTSPNGKLSDLFRGLVLSPVFTTRIAGGMQ